METKNFKTKPPTVPVRIGRVLVENFVEVKSSRILKAHHDGDTLMTLIFKGGRAYEYIAPKEVYDALISAESPGVYFQENVFKKYQYFEVRSYYGS